MQNHFKTLHVKRKKICIILFFLILHQNLDVIYPQGIADTSVESLSAT